MHSTQHWRRVSISNNEINGSEATMKSLIAHSDELMNDLQQYFDKHDKHMSFLETVH